MNTSFPKSPFALNGTIVLVCFDRPKQLCVVIDYLKSAQDFNLFDIIVVQQLGNHEVSRVIRDSLNDAKVIQTDYKETTSIAARISSNVHLGVSEAFLDPNCDFVVVLEDDIVVAHDFLWFVRFVVWKMANLKDFRAVNGFSKMQNKPFRKNYPLGYVRLNFGVGWGWAMTRKTFLELDGLWRGDDDLHWDGLIEDYMRTGFVVNPLLSRIANIGLDGLGAHSGIDNVLELEILNSFENHNIESNHEPFHEKSSTFTWRKDCYNISTMPRFMAFLQFKVWQIVLRMKCSMMHHSRSPSKIKRYFSTRAYSVVSRLARKIQLILSKNQSVDSG